MDFRKKKLELASDEMAAIAESILKEYEKLQ